jgi:uncharacterized membrane protein HdeD (DUF308 family)
VIETLTALALATGAVVYVFFFAATADELLILFVLIFLVTGIICYLSAIFIVFRRRKNCEISLKIISVAIAVLHLSTAFILY